MNKNNLKRLALHVALTAVGGAVAAVGLELSHNNNPAVVYAASLLTNYVASFIRKEEAAN